MLKKPCQGDIDALKKIIADQQIQIQELEKINEMHVCAEELARQERISADKLVEAQQKLHELAEQERFEAEEMIQAQQRVQQLAEQERKEAAQLVEARELIQALAEKERLDAEELIKAQQQIHAMSEKERKDAAAFIEIHKNIEELSILEIKQRDAILASILQINSKLNNLQATDTLLDETLTQAMTLLNADAGLIALQGRGEHELKVAKGFSEERNMEELLSSFKNKPKNPQKERAWSLSSQLTREDRVVGCLYLERKKEAPKFRRVESEFLEILASQVSLAFNNTLLFNRLKMQNREMRRMIMLKNNFIEHLSEDLKKPIEQLSVLARKVSIDTQQKKMSGLIQRINSAIDKIITISSLQREVAEMFSHAVDVEQLIKDIVKGLHKVVKRKKINIEIKNRNAVAPIEANYDVVHTILDEIICNAVVYNRDRGKVDILLERKDQRLLITVRDTGVGIKKEEQKKVFDRFFRSESSYELYERGAGLGLYIVRSFIKTYGGTLSLASNAGEGTEIIIELPA